MECDFFLSEAVMRQSCGRCWLTASSQSQLWTCMFLWNKGSVRDHVDLNSNAKIIRRKRLLFSSSSINNAKGKNV